MQRSIRWHAIKLRTKLAFCCAVVTLVLALIYSFVAYATCVPTCTNDGVLTKNHVALPDWLPGCEAFPTASNQESDCIIANEGRNNQPLLDESREQQQDLTNKVELLWSSRLQTVNAEHVLNRYAALVEYMKYFIPAFGLLLITGLITLGYWFVDGRMATSELRMRDRADKEVKERVGTFEKYKLELKAELLKEQIQSDYRLAALCWRAEDMQSAIVYSKRVLKRIEEARLGAQSEEDKLKLAHFQEAAKGDLAYYYAWQYKKLREGSGDTRDIEESKSEALRLARDLVETIRQTPESQRIGMMDNYLFVVLTTEPADTGYKETFKEWFGAYKEQLRRHLIVRLPTDEANELLERYENFYAQR